MYTEERADGTKITEKPYFVVVDDVQVFTADFVFGQLQCKGRYIDRVRALALFAIALSCIQTAIILVLLLR